MAGSQSPASREARAFDVFLSYSRKDKEIAERLEKALEEYQIPRSLRDAVGNLNIFRDEEDIRAAEDYFRAIEEYLRVSTKLIVICSPDARKSKYVADEIGKFISARGVQNIIPVIVRGKPNNETADEEEMAFPEQLVENRMPLAANFLGWESYDGKLPKGPYRNAFYSVLAAVIDVDRRRLEQIDEKMRARRRRIILSIAGAVILLLSIALVFALLSRREAIRQRQEAIRQTEIATAARQEAETARQTLSRQYLEAIGEMSIGQVLGVNAIPGEIALTGEWTPLLQKDEKTFAAGREYGKGRILVVAHDGVLVEQFEQLVRRAFEWLRGSQRSQLVYAASGHCEWVTTHNLRFPGRLEQEGYQVRALSGPIDDDALKETGVLLIGNAWVDLTEVERAAVERFVARGGGLFAAGLGWAWLEYGAKYRCAQALPGSPPINLDTYPMNRLLGLFGARFTENYWQQ